MLKLLLCLLLMGTGLVAGAGQLEITSFTPDNAELVFKTADSGTAHHNYRVEAATSLVAAAWSVQRTAGGVGAAASVTNLVTTDANSMFYRVVATSNSAIFVDGPYMAVDISVGTNAASYPVAYYRTLADVAGGVNSDIYKTDKILLRLIPKGSYTMGSPTDEIGRNPDETQHTVTLTKDFYMGVYEVTQRQWELVMGDTNSYFNNSSYYATRPVEMVSYYEIREDPFPVADEWTAGSHDPAVDWPVNGMVNANSFMGKLRVKTGLATFDLPTESQWEYACRAGTTTALNSGYNLTNEDSDPRMDTAGRYWYNGGSGFSQDCPTSAGTAAVGSCLPNAWGLYDMHGNVWEWCLDRYETYPGTVTDPLGSSSGSSRVFRGASWYSDAYFCRSASRYDSYPNGRNYSIGFRLVRSLP